MSLDLHAWFEDFKHLDWFEQYFEIYIKGSGPDLTKNYLNCSFDQWSHLRDFADLEVNTKRIYIYTFN